MTKSEHFAVADDSAGEDSVVAASTAVSKPPASFAPVALLTINASTPIDYM